MRNTIIDNEIGIGFVGKTHHTSVNNNTVSDIRTYGITDY